MPGAARIRAIISLAAVLTVAVGAAAAPAGSQDPVDTLGKTTVDQRLIPDDDGGFRNLGLGPGEGYVLREQGVGTARAGREERRRSLLYVGQLSDFQLADEESPARVEFLDFGPFSAAWRPWEAMNAHVDDAMIRQLNAFAGASPVPAGDGSRRPMDFTVNTGDIADSQQLNETEWVRTLMEGGELRPGSGINPASSGDPLCTALSALGLIADGNAPQRYTGVQDADDFVEPPLGQFYDPDDPRGAFGDWPQYPGLLDRTQEAFEAAGLDVPSYVTFGNHDALVQGNAAANAAYELVATGCLKVMLPAAADPQTLEEGLGALDLSNLLNLLATDPAELMFVPPDPKRRFVSKEQYKQVFRTGGQQDGHGFEFIDPAEEAASNGAAGYYSWSPEPGFRFISLDTVSEAGVIGVSDKGNVDHPQFQWLRGELTEATQNDELVVLFSHHGIPSLNADVPDEIAPRARLPTPTGTTSTPAATSTPATPPRSTSGPTWPASCTSSRT